MSIGAMIIGGIVVISLAGMLGEVLKTALSRKPPTTASVSDRDLSALASRIDLLEARLEEREATVAKLQDEVRFVTRMLEDKTARPS